jgi:hypothetical protein
MTRSCPYCATALEIKDEEKEAHILNSSKAEFEAERGLFYTVLYYIFLTLSLSLL